MSANVLKHWSDILTIASHCKCKNPLSNFISVYQGDITKIKIDAIVNAANSSLLGGGGVDGAIHRAAGRGLYMECKKLCGCKIGEVKVTGGHNIKHINHIIHTVGPQVRSGVTDENAKQLRSCYVQALNAAAANNDRTIAFPCISTGIYGYPSEDACNLVVPTVISWLLEDKNQGKIDRVVFVTFLEKDYELYIDCLNAKLS